MVALKVGRDSPAQIALWAAVGLLVGILASLLFPMPEVASLSPPVVAARRTSLPTAELPDSKVCISMDKSGSLTGDSAEALRGAALSIVDVLSSSWAPTQRVLVSFGEFASHVNNGTRLEMKDLSSVEHVNTLRARIGDPGVMRENDTNFLEAIDDCIHQAAVAGADRTPGFINQIIMTDGRPDFDSQDGATILGQIRDKVSVNKNLQLTLLAPDWSRGDSVLQSWTNFGARVMYIPQGVSSQELTRFLVTQGLYRSLVPSLHAMEAGSIHASMKIPCSASCFEFEARAVWTSSDLELVVRGPSEQRFELRSGKGEIHATEDTLGDWTATVERGIGLISLSAKYPSVSLVHPEIPLGMNTPLRLRLEPLDVAEIRSRDIKLEAEVLAPDDVSYMYRFSWDNGRVDTFTSEQRAPTSVGGVFTVRPFLNDNEGRHYLEPVEFRVIAAPYVEMTSHREILGTRLEFRLLERGYPVTDGRFGAVSDGSLKLSVNGRSHPLQMGEGAGWWTTIRPDFYSGPTDVSIEAETLGLTSTFREALGVREVVLLPAGVVWLVRAALKMASIGVIVVLLLWIAWLTYMRMHAGRCRIHENILHWRPVREYHVLNVGWKVEAAPRGKKRRRRIVVLWHDAKGVSARRGFVPWPLDAKSIVEYEPTPDVLFGVRLDKGDSADF